MFFTGSDNKEKEEEQLSEEEESEEEEEQEEEEASDEGEDEEVTEAFKFNFERENQENRLEFHQRCREIFVEEWLKTEGNWFDSLKSEHLAFLRDILNIPSSSSHSPSFFSGLKQ